MKGKQAKPPSHHDHLFTFSHFSSQTGTAPGDHNSWSQGSLQPFTSRLNSDREVFKNGNKYCRFSTGKATGCERQKIPPGELVPYSSINLPHQREEVSRIPTAHGISYQHLRSRRQTIDCWFLWEEGKIIKHLLSTDQLEDMTVTSAPESQHLQGNLSSPFSVAAEGFVQVLPRSPRCVSASHSHCLKRSTDVV